MDRPPFLGKAEEAVAAAEELLEKTRLDSAASRAYYAVFHAARAAVIAAGLSSPDRQWSHEAIQGGFAQLVNRRKIYPSQLLSDLTHLLNMRLLADYGLPSVSSRQARDVVKKARHFVAVVSREIEQ
jgi:uncharacterized protein (UPF0332 family)